MLKRWIECLIEALVLSALFFLPFYNEALLKTSFLAETPYTRILFRAALMLWLLKKIVYREPLKISFAQGALWMFVAWCGLSLFRLNAATSSAGMEVFWRIAEGAALFTFSSDFYTEKYRKQRLIDFFIFWTMLACVSGLWQMLSPAGRDFLAGRWPEAPGRMYRMSGPFGSPNGLATFLLLAIPLSFQRFASQRFSGRGFAWTALLALFSVCFLATFSRAAFFALWFTAIAYCLYRRLWNVVCLAALLPFAAALLSPPLRENFFSSLNLADITVGYRFEAWKLAWQTLQTHPLAGAGLGSLQGILRPFSPDSANFVAHAHNSYLETAAESGWLGLLLFSAAVVFALGTRGQSALRFGLLAIAVHAFFDVDFQRYKMVSLFWLFAGLLSHSPETQKEEPALPAAGPVVTTALFIIAAVFPFTRTELRSFFLDIAPYYLLWVLAACWAGSATRVLIQIGRPAVMAFLRRSWMPILGLVLLSAAVFCLVKPQLRVLSDEAMLLAVSKSMATERCLDYVSEGYWRGNDYVALTRAQDVRPFGFPFAVHVAHRLTGFRAGNVFAVNFILLVGVLSLVYGLVRRYAGSAWAIAAALAVLAQPIVLLCATSGGFELYQVFWILAALAAFFYYCDAPDSEPRFFLAWMSLVILSHARYESVVFFLVVIPAMFLTRTAPAFFLRRNPFYAMSCFFFLPLLWQRIAMLHYFPPTIPYGTPLWSVHAFVHNLLLFLDSILRPRPDWPYDPFLNATGILAILWGSWQLLRGRWKLDLKIKTVLLSFGAAIALEVAGLTAYAESGLHLPQSARYFLLGSILFSVAAVLGARHFFGERKSRAAVVLCGILFFIYLPVAGANKHWDEHRANFEYRFVKNFLDKEGLDPKKTVLIAQRPVVYASQGYSSLSFGAISSGSATRGKIISSLSPDVRIFAVQEYHRDMLFDATSLPAGWPLHRINRIEDRSGKAWEISELKSVEAPF